jgi:acyl-CoA hydrolase
LYLVPEVRTKAREKQEKREEVSAMSSVSPNPNVPMRKVSESQSEMTELILPNDTNTLGNLLGGRLMHFIDLVGAMAAYRHSRTHVVTASMEHIDFIAPVHVGDLLILKSSLNRAFNTSMEVGVKVWVENTISAGMHRHVASAYLTFVAVDPQGRRVQVPRLDPQTADEKRRYEDAGRRREYRLSESSRKRIMREPVTASELSTSNS